MAYQIGGSFETSFEGEVYDRGQQAVEAGASQQKNNSQVQNKAEDFKDFLRISLGKEGQPIVQETVRETIIESFETSSFKINGELRWEGNQLKETRPAEEQLRVDVKPNIQAESSPPIKKEDFFAYAENSVKNIYKEVKEVTNSILGLINEYILFKTLTPEQKKKKEEEDKKQKEKAINIRQFIQDYKNGLVELFGLKQKQKEADQKRLGVLGIGLEEKNELLGMGNLSYEKSDGIYHLEEAAKAMWRKRQEELKKKKQQEAVAKGDGVDRTQIKYAGEMGGSQHVLNTAG